VSVRTVQYYDRLGLLRAARSRAGYRLFAEAALHDLLLIRVLRFAGLPLDQVKSLMAADRVRLREALERQRASLRDRIAGLQHAIGALRSLEEALAADGAVDTSLLGAVAEGIDGRTDAGRARRYQDRVRAMVDSVTHNIDRFRQLGAVAREIERLGTVDPSSPDAQAALDRWLEASKSGTPVDTQTLRVVQEQFKGMFGDAPDLKDALPKLASPLLLGFIDRAIAARKAVP
jgi:DNA-binding transcriptional MerR regulator